MSSAVEAAAPAEEARFTFYGLTIVVESASVTLLDEISRDFYCFPASPSPSEFRIRAHAAAPRYDDLPALRAAFLTPRNVCYRDGAVTYIDYFGRALAVFDRLGRQCTIQSDDADLLYEIVYLAVLSLVGEHLDGRHLHRVHALGLSHRGRGVLVLLPSGGGKSTLAMAALHGPDTLLLAEDTPLVDRAARMHPFPLRVGVRPDARHNVPAKHVRTIRRMEFAPKTLVDIEYFRDRLGAAVDAKLLFIGERNLGKRCEIVPATARETFKALTKYMVVGLGVYQGLEFLLERGVGDLAGKGVVGFSRLRNAFALQRATRAYRFVLGRDQERNAQTLLEFLARA